MTYTVTLKRGEERRILAGHSWVYANEVSKIEGDGGLGSLATVQSCNGTFLGKGYINHLSKILVRIFIRDPEEQDTEELFTERLFRANALRRDLGYDSAYRLCFSESDGLPSLIADKYGDVIVISILSLGFRKKRDMIVRALVKLFSPAAIYERSESPVLKKEGMEPYSGLLYGALPEKTVIEENGLKLYVDVVNGQKTGYFLDQKENRMALRRYSVGKRVLDCFCNVGGFTLNAATVAKSVKAVDISERALEELKANAQRYRGMRGRVRIFKRRPEARRNLSDDNSGPSRVLQKRVRGRGRGTRLPRHKRRRHKNNRGRRVPRHRVVFALYERGAVRKDIEGSGRKRGQALENTGKAHAGV